MNYTEIKEHIYQNFAKANLAIEDLRVQPDAFTGWRIAIISSAFANKSLAERQQIALAGLENITIQWLDLLTPNESEWAGNLPLDSPLEDLPLWPEALARGNHIPEQEKILFPSDLDEDLKPPIIATFYSLKGGVGRSTALAYTATILAKKGKTVLCVDMDLEAPGLASLFGKEKEVREDQGVVSLLLALDQGENPPIQEHILRFSDTEELYGIPAGKANANYARLLTFINPDAWYREDKNPLRQLIDLLSNSLSFKPDVILLDASTGITALNAPLLFDLADIAMIVFFPHPQTEIGTAALVKALLASKTKRPGKFLTPELRFLVSPIPASKSPEVVTKYRHRALEWISNWLYELQIRRSTGDKIMETDITHFIPYREVLATADQILSEPEILSDFEPLAEWLELFLPTRNEPLIERLNIAELKEKLLNESSNV